MFSPHLPFFWFITFWTLISIAALILVIMLVLKSIAHSQKMRSEVLKAMIEKGIYDPRAFESPAGGAATLGWGIVLISVGAAIIIGLLITGAVHGLVGALIPLFVGIGLLVTHAVVRTSAAKNARYTAPTVPPTGTTSAGMSGPGRVRPEDHVQGQD